MHDPNIIEILLTQPELPTPWQHKSNLTGLKVEKDLLFSFMTRLKNEFGFKVLSSHTVLDWVEQNQFELLYVVFAPETGTQIFISTLIEREQPVIPSLHQIWPIAEWQEREAYDLFGILYDNHPDLRRIFLDDDWNGFPLRKDYKDDFMLEAPEK